MAVGDTYTSSIKFDLSVKETSKSPGGHGKRIPRIRTPRAKTPTKGFTSVSTTEVVKNNIEASVPDIDETNNVPYLVGTRRAMSPSCFWHGNQRTKFEREVRETTETKTQRIKLAYNEWEEREITVEKKTTIYTPVDYYITVAVGLAHGPHVRLKAIYAEDEVIWSGTTVDGFNEINLQKGPFRQAFFYSGEWDQPQNDLLINLLGEENVSRYPGLAYLVIPTIASKDYGGSALTYELERVEFDNGIPGVIDATNATGDVNVASAMYEVFRNDWPGLGLDESMMDTTAWAAWFDRCEARNYYVSWYDAQEDYGSGYIETLCGLFSAICFVDLDSEKITVREYHSDNYDIGDAISFDPSNVIDVQEVERIDWALVPTHFKIEYAARRDVYKYAQIERLNYAANTPDKKGTYAPTAMRAAVVTTEDVASALLTRVIMHNGAPALELQIRVNSDGQKVTLGEPIKLTWPPYGFVDEPFWVTNIKSTDIELNQVVLEGYYYERYEVDDYDDVPADTIWTEPPKDPVKPVHAVVLTDKLLPPLLFKQGLGPNYRAEKRRYTQYAMILVRAENNQQVAVNVHRHNDGSILRANMPYCASGFIVNAITRRFGAEDGWIGDIELSDATFTNIVDNEGGIAYCNGEWFKFTGVDKVGDSHFVRNVQRGIWGSELVALAVDDVFYMMDDASRLVGPFKQRVTRRFMLTTVARNGSGKWPADALDMGPTLIVNSTNTACAPHKVTVNGARWYPDDIVPTVFITPEAQFPDSMVYNAMTWLNQWRQSTTADTMNDDIRSSEHEFDSDDVYEAYITDSLASELFLGETGLPQTFEADFNFEDQTFAILENNDDIVPGTGTIKLVHKIGRAKSREILIPVEIVIVGLVVDLTTDYKIGFNASLRMDWTAYT